MFYGIIKKYVIKFYFSYQYLKNNECIKSEKIKLITIQSLCLKLPKWAAWCISPMRFLKHKPALSHIKYITK